MGKIITSADRRPAPNKRGRGSTLVEFAIVAPVFFLLMLAIVDFGVLFWANLTMQHAVREGARYAVTGQSNLDPDTAQQYRYRAVIQQIKNNSMGIYDRVNPTLVVTVNSGTPQTYGDPTAYSTSMFGGPGDVVVLQLNCTWPVMTPLIQPFFSGGVYRFSVAATMRNETFP